MKRKKLPKNRHKGMFIYCSTCKKHFSWTDKRIKNNSVEPLCGKKKVKLSKCSNLDKHKYKVRVHIPKTTHGQVSKTLRAENYKDAVLEAIDFENSFFATLKTNKQDGETYQGKLIYLFDAQLAYLDFLANVNVPEHLQVERGEDHINEQSKCLELFNQALKKHKINSKLIMLNKINDVHVGHYHAYLMDQQKYAPRTYNNKMKALRYFFEWAIENYELETKNPFKKVRDRFAPTNIETITQTEFNNLLKITTPERGLSKGRAKKRDYVRNMYRDYLKDGFLLALHTGGRREEVVSMKWNMIHYIDNKPAYIMIKNLKVERSLGKGFNGNVPPKFVPITKGLLNILLNLGYNKYKDTDRFILYPERETSTKTVMESLSRGFSHYYKQLNTNRVLQFKCLRKTFLTYLKLAAKDDARLLSSHSTDEVLEKHYIDQRIVSTAIQNLNIFGSKK